LPLSSRSIAPIICRNGVGGKGRGSIMKWDDIESHWPQLQQRAQRHWFHLTQSDVQGIAGTRDELAGRVQERYGLSREEAEKEVDAWAFFLTMETEQVAEDV
jgi:uncharacterized protein YjbJ (UPF0337 family)